jgi:hypothetical protein
MMELKQVRHVGVAHWVELEISIEREMKKVSKKEMQSCRDHQALQMRLNQAASLQSDLLVVARRAGQQLSM